MNFRSKITIILLLLFTVPTLFFLLITGQTVQREFEMEAIDKLNAVADIQEKRLHMAIESYVGKAHMVASGPALFKLLEQYVVSPDATLFGQLQLHMEGVENVIPEVRMAALYDAEGRRILSTNIEEHSYEAVMPPSLLGATSFQIVDVYKNPSNILRVEVLGPIRAGGKVIGFLQVVSSADALISVTDDYTGLGATGEVMLVKRNKAGDAVYLTPLRFDSSAALSRAASRERNHDAAIQAISGAEGIFTNLADYRNTAVFTAVRFVDGPSWGIAAKIDRNEVLGPLLMIMRLLVVMTAVTTAFVLVFAIILAKRMTLPIQELVHTASRVQKGDFAARAPETRTDEIGQLAGAFNIMTATLQGFYRDLDKKVRNRTRALATAQAKDKAVLASIGEGLVVADATGQIVFVNKVAMEMLGTTRSDTSLKSWQRDFDIFDGKTMHPLTPQETPIARALRGQEIIGETIFVQNETVHQGKYLRVSANPIRGVGGKIMGAVSIFHDTTEEMRVDKAKSEFVSLASHQLRTPLTSINWYTEMLLAGDAGKLNAEQKQYLHEVYQENQRMVALVNSLLNASRLEIGSFKVAPQPTDLKKLLRQVLDEQEVTLLERKQRVVIKRTPAIPRVPVDQQLMQMVFQNLITNAIKYSPVGGKIEVMLCQDKGGHIRFSVKDSGLGIPAAQQKEVFSKLFRADNVKNAVSQGTGLGLYMVKTIMDEVGGKVSFVSSEAEGSTFSIVLPRRGMKSRK